ncbi:AP2/ERF and B3 domain-containing protein Os01g0141000-like [Magnolia sinica]|uniref:AP2/ERF and B3 domain-containing protein Os01g0141000-like n=1 Tax=Magnolia sinica TaxID=86752 RepID=UPI0026585F7B|nr:AP2/ERF and B3 domain-containing protein Os01g0141000-like [Magnolia sinica]
MNSIEEESFPDFTNLFLLAECACAGRPSSPPPCKKLCGPGLPSSSPPWKKLHGPWPPSSSLPYKKLRGPEAPPLIGWLEAHVRLKGTTPLCFGQKLLTQTDTEDNHNRLLIPKEMIRQIMLANVMTDEEKAKVRSGNEGLHVLVLDRMGRTWGLVFKYWESCNSHVLIGKWKRLVKENGLRANVDHVNLWAFRAGGPNGPLRFVVA